MKTALITGGSRGIGRESAITLARQDHAVVINYAGSAEDADNTVREIESFGGKARSEEHTSELQSLMRISYAVVCLKKNSQIDRKRNEDTMTRTQTSINAITFRESQ